MGCNPVNASEIQNGNWFRPASGLWCIYCFTLTHKSLHVHVVFIWLGVTQCVSWQGHYSVGQNNLINIYTYIRWRREEGVGFTTIYFTEQYFYKCNADYYCSLIRLNYVLPWKNIRLALSVCIIIVYFIYLCYYPICCIFFIHAVFQSHVRLSPLNAKRVVNHGGNVAVPFNMAFCSVAKE